MTARVYSTFTPLDPGKLLLSLPSDGTLPSYLRIRVTPARWSCQTVSRSSSCLATKPHGLANRREAGRWARPMGMAARTRLPVSHLGGHSLCFSLNPFLNFICECEEPMTSRIHSHM